jgi:hypothetical protein
VAVQYMTKDAKSVDRTLGDLWRHLFQKLHPDLHLHVLVRSLASCKFFLVFVTIATLFEAIINFNCRPDVLSDV